MILRLITFTVTLVIVVGLVLHFQIGADLVPFWVGRLPGDLILRSGQVAVYFPFTTALILSAILSILVSAFQRR